MSKSNSGSTTVHGGGENLINPQALSNFMAGDETVKIVPSFNMKTRLNLISKTIGPFHENVEMSDVPLWMALHLRKRNLCRITAPDWFDSLKQVLEYEKDPNNLTFSEDFPFRHAEIARSILNVAASDIPNADSIRSLLEDIETVRMDKIRYNIRTLSRDALEREDALPAIDVTGIGSLEIQAIRPFLTKGFAAHHLLSGNNDKQGERSGGSYSSTMRGSLQRSTIGTESAFDASTQEQDAPINPPTTGRSRLRRFR